MSNFNKPKTLLVTLLTCAAFSAHAAWWDAWKSAGDDGNVKTKGNAKLQPPNLRVQLYMLQSLIIQILY